MSKLYLQEKLVGEPGQVVGFDTSGKAVAKEDGALLKTGGISTGKTTFAGGLAITNAAENTNIQFLLGIKAFAEGGDVQYMPISALIDIIKSQSPSAKIMTGAYLGTGANTKSFPLPSGTTKAAAFILAKSESEGRLNSVIAIPPLWINIGFYGGIYRADGECSLANNTLTLSGANYSYNSESTWVFNKGYQYVILYS